MNRIILIARSLFRRFCIGLAPTCGYIAIIYFWVNLADDWWRDEHWLIAVPMLVIAHAFLIAFAPLYWRLVILGKEE